MSRGTAFAKIAGMAQLLDNIGLHDDATVMDEFLEAAMETGFRKEAGLWKNILSRLSGLARRALFSEYRAMWKAAKEAQDVVNDRLLELQTTNDELKQMLARHELVDWRENAAAVITGMGQTEADILSDYDEQYAKMTARLLKLTPKTEKKPIVPPLLPEEKPEEAVPVSEEAMPVSEEVAKREGEPEEGKTLKEGLEEALPERPEEAIPLTTVKKTEPEVVSTPSVAVAPETPMPIETKPLSGWKEETFGRSKSRGGGGGWEWKWEVSPDNNQLRMPKSQLAEISGGKGKILHKHDGKYWPTGGTSSIKLRKLMGDTFWKEEGDSSDPNMVILVRTEEQVPPPLTMHQRQTTATERMKRIIVLASDLVDKKTDEERLEAAATMLLKDFEDEEE